MFLMHCDLHAHIFIVHTSASYVPSHSMFLPHSIMIIIVLNYTGHFVSPELVCVYTLIIIIIFIRINNYIYTVHIQHLSTNYINIFRIKIKINIYKTIIDTQS